MLRLARRLLVLLFAASLAWAIAAQAAPLRIGDAGHYRLEPHLAYLEDPDGRLTIEDIMQPQHQRRFGPLPESNFGITRSAIWAAIALEPVAGSDPHWLLEIAYPPLDHVEVYVPQPGGGWQRLRAGDHEPRDPRALPHRNYVLPVDLPPGQASVLYVRLRTVGTMAVPLELWRPHALWQHDQVGYALLALYFGSLIGLMLYNLLLFVAVRDVAYLLYAGFVAAMGLTQAALNGFGQQFLWPHASGWNATAPNAALGLMVALGVLFARQYLDARFAMPRLNRLLVALAVLWTITMLGSGLLLPYVVSVVLIPLLTPPTMVTLLATGVVALRRGHGGARAYLAAWTVLLLGAFGLFLHSIGVVPSNGFTANSMLIGSGVEMVLLSFALAGRINVARRFKEQAQLRIAAERALAESLGEAHKHLKLQLQEREGLLENALAGIAFISPEGRLTWANRALQEMFRESRRGVSSMERFYLSREQYLEVGQEAAAALARGDVYQREVELQRADGSRLWVRLSGRAVREYDRTQGTAWVVVDITRERELEAQLQRALAERDAAREHRDAAVGSLRVGTQPVGSQALGTQALGTQAAGTQAVGTQAVGTQAAGEVGKAA